MARPQMRKDLTGKRFGKLVVDCVDEDRSEDAKVYWWCNCDCGNRKSILSTALTRSKNNTKSCGCARNSLEAQLKARVTRQSYPQNITDYKFGRLTAKRKTTIKSNRAADNGACLWECLCECGNTCYYSRYALITPNGVRSCGCLYNDTRSTTAKKYNFYDLDNYDFGIGYCDNGTYFFFDKEDYDKIKNYSWWYDGRYVIAHSLKDDKYTTGIVRMHRVVMDIPDREDIEVDHKNLIRYDCRKCNLRRATTFENATNKDLSKYSPTGVTGVKKVRSKWLASITCNGKTIRLGLFELFEDAVKARQSAETELFKEFKFDMSNKDVIDEENMDKYRTFKQAI